MWTMEYESSPLIHSANIFNAASVPDIAPSSGEYGCGQNCQDDNSLEPLLLRRFCVTVEGRLVSDSETSAPRPASHSSCTLI